MGNLMHDFSCADPAEIRDPLLRERAQYFKTNEKGVAEVCRSMEEMRDKYYEQGIEQGDENRLISSVRALMTKLGYSAQQALDVFDVPDSDRSRYLAMLA